MTGSFEGCRLDVRPPAARLELARPPLNVLDLRTIGELQRALDSLRARDEVVTLVIASGAGVPFSAGVAVEDHLPEKLDDMLESFHRFCLGLLEAPQVTIAAVAGFALGGGMELAACCDFGIASEDAVFGQPEIDLACFPPLGAALYPALFGPRLASRIVLLGERFPAAEAKSLGLVDRVVPRERLPEEAAALADELHRKSPAALRLAKRALRIAARSALEALPEIEALYRDDLAATEDMLEGLQAFLEKRRPIWKGR